MRGFFFHILVLSAGTMPTGTVPLAPVHFFVMLRHVERTQAQGRQHRSREKRRIRPCRHTQCQRPRRHCRTILRKANQRLRQQNTRHRYRTNKLKYPERGCSRINFHHFRLRLRIRQSHEAFQTLLCRFARLNDHLFAMLRMIPCFNLHRIRHLRLLVELLRKINQRRKRVGVNFTNIFKVVNHSSAKNNENPHAGKRNFSPNQKTT